MSTLIDKYRKLSDRLYLRNADKKLNWEYDETESRISVNFGDNTLTLSQSSNENFEDLYVVHIYDKDGRQIESFTDEEIDKAQPPVGSFPTYYFLLKDVYHSGIRHVTGADNVLDDILEQLRNPFDDDSF